MGYFQLVGYFQFLIILIIHITKTVFLKEIFRIHYIILV